MRDGAEILTSGVADHSIASKRNSTMAVARSLLVAGFGRESVSKVEHDDLKAGVADLARSSLDRDDVVLVA